MNVRLERIALAFSSGFLALAALLGWWAVVRAPGLTDRADNPRHSVRERYYRRGQILDRNGQTLAVTDGVPGDYRRAYPVPEAAPVVGYDSAQFGLSGLEASLDSVLSGWEGNDSWKAWREGLLYGGPKAGYDVQTSLDASLQRGASRVLNDLGRGAAVLLEVDTGEVLILASSPSFDPSRLDEDWATLLNDPASPLLNRATQGHYPPGGAIQPIILAASLAANLVDPASTIQDAARPIAVEGLRVRCRLDAPNMTSLTLGVAFIYACPEPMVQLGRALGVPALLDSFEDFGFFQPASFELPVADLQAFQLLPGEVAAEALGQGKLLVSPLRMALVAAALANGGIMPAPRIVLRTQSDAGWHVFPATATLQRVIPENAAKEVARLMTQPDSTDAGILGLMSLPRVAGHMSTSYTDAEGTRMAWYIGFAPVDRPRFAVAVALEDQSAFQAAALGWLLLARALTP